MKDPFEGEMIPLNEDCLLERMALLSDNEPLTVGKACTAEGCTIKFVSSEEMEDGFEPKGECVELLDLGLDEE